MSHIAGKLGIQRKKVAKWGNRFLENGIDGLFDRGGRGRKPVFSPEVACHIVKIACERPEKFGRSLSQWDSSELARQLVLDGIVDSISASTVRKILQSHKLKPWRNHMWMSPKHPRDEEFYIRVGNIIRLPVNSCGMQIMLISAN